MNNKLIETHPFPPFLPKQAKVLMMGTFPPPENKWCMPFFYPNYINDMWRIMGIIFFDDKNHFIDLNNKICKEEEIRAFANTLGLALSDTGYKAHREKGNASDKYLDIVEARNIRELLDQIPECTIILTTGEKAMEIACKQFDELSVPKMGGHITVNYNGRSVDIYRMPSSSRAYPLKIEKKADIYRVPLMKVFNLKE